MPSVEQVGRYLESLIPTEAPVTYSDVIRKFPDLPPLTEIWSNHPLCALFGELDREDDAACRPFRTAMVIAKERNMPGPGFFRTLEELRGLSIKQKDQMAVWLFELKRLIADQANKP